MMFSSLSLSRRNLLGSAAATACGLTLAGSATLAFAAELPESQGKVDMADVLQAGPLPEMALGDEKAKVTIVEYMSMTCPHCAHFHTTTFDAIKQKYVDSGKVRFIVREFPFDPVATAAFMLARTNPSNTKELAAPQQYFAMVSMLFKQQRAWAAPADGNVRNALLQASKIAGFTQESFEATLTNQKLLDDVNATMKRGADKFGVNSTPTFLINGNRYSGDMSVETMSALIDSML
ncbi:DsbA family protein [Rhizobium oryzicola]|uniref:DsbA family protein n=1 Tax=Rhizobium oryzicola TaxID=1232668 RepID=A0ABT8SSF8_9HYPH|nr:DsbA family protein [Rhizobium oryzicola]MDO1581337.1 DsbA family protein [Rhizobium oryzicola]